MVDFKTLKNNSGKSSIEKLNAEMEKLNKSYSNDDDRFWRPQRDKAGNGYAVFRFLPAPTGETVPYIRKWDHGFKGPGGWYIEESLTTLGKDDPVSQYNSNCWNAGDKQTARNQARRLYFISNVYVIKDTNNPENDGKNFLYRYGKKIWDKIEDSMHPQDSSETPVNPFDFWEGANFKLKIKTIQEGNNSYPNYDMSVFDNPAPLFKDDSELEALWNKQYSLQEFLKPENFKSYEELKERLHKVLQLDTPTETREAPKETAPKKQKEKAPEKEPEVDIEDDEDMKNFFAKLHEN